MSSSSDSSVLTLSRKCSPEQLAAFFHDGDIGSERAVFYGIKKAVSLFMIEVSHSVNMFFEAAFVNKAH